MTSFRLIDDLGDAPEILAWVQQHFHAGVAAGVFSRRMAEPAAGDGRHCLLAEREPGRLGFATFYRPYEDQHFVWIDLLWVEPDARRQGIGTSLIAAVADNCRARHGAPFEIGLGTLHANLAMQSLALRAGFAVGAIQFSRVVE